MIYIDTSAFYAIIDQDDGYHESAKNTWVSLILRKESLACNNYVLVETVALLQNRFGKNAVLDLQKMLPLLSIDWIAAEQHRFAIAMLIPVNHRKMNLVDCSSFDTTQRFGINTGFTFDKHFREHRFEIIP